MRVLAAMVGAALLACQPVPPAAPRPYRPATRPPPRATLEPPLEPYQLPHPVVGAAAFPTPAGTWLVGGSDGMGGQSGVLLLRPGSRRWEHVGPAAIDEVVCSGLDAQLRPVLLGNRALAGEKVALRLDPASGQLTEVWAGVGQMAFCTLAGDDAFLYDGNTQHLDLLDGVDDGVPPARDLLFPVPLPAGGFVWHAEKALLSHPSFTWAQHVPVPGPTWASPGPVIVEAGCEGYLLVVWNGKLCLAVAGGGGIAPVLPLLTWQMSGPSRYSCARAGDRLVINVGQVQAAAPTLVFQIDTRDPAKLVHLSTDGLNHGGQALATWDGAVWLVGGLNDDQTRPKRLTP